MESVTDIVTGSRWSRWRILMWGAAAALLALPAVAMQFTGEVAWSARDFLIMGSMLAVACLTCELAARASVNGAYRIGAALAVGTAFLTVWANLAVGMIGSESNSYNLVFAAVIGIAIVGSIIARFEPLGMARAMLIAAIAQGTVGAIGLQMDTRGALFSITFAGFWLLSSCLFRMAARQQRTAFP